MYARSGILVVLAGIALGAAANPSPHFSFRTTGAITLNVSGREAVYGVILSPGQVNRRVMLNLSLGGTTGQGSVMLYLPGDRIPKVGLYPIRSSWEENRTEKHPFQACFLAGSAEHPLGWFHGESGWVRITEAGVGRVSGQFEMRARGFMHNDPDDENQWVIIRGSFEAQGDSAIATISFLQ
jgi:hypothetical protein